MYLVSWYDYEGSTLRTCEDKDALIKLVLNLKADGTVYKVYEAKEIKVDVQLVIEKETDDSYSNHRR